MGQILAGTDYRDFFDSENLHSRLIQYQKEKFLRAADDGWIMHRGRYCRGALQAEDEEAWGRSFLLWVLADTETLRREFLIVREISRDIPHREQDDRWQRIRGLSKTISDSMPSFIDIRVKIHGQPDKTDAGRVEKFFYMNKPVLSENLQNLFITLIDDLNWAFRNADIET